MKARLEFNLDDPSDAVKFQQCLSADRTTLAITEFGKWIAEHCTHEDGEVAGFSTAVMNKLLSSFAKHDVQRSFYDTMNQAN